MSDIRLMLNNPKEWPKESIGHRPIRGMDSVAKTVHRFYT